MPTSQATNDSIDDVRVMHDVSWSAFESFLVERGDAKPRIAYLEGTLVTMSPSPKHEMLRKILAMVVEAHLDLIDPDWNGIGAWLLRSEPKGAGLEPDECYRIGDLSKERPDLALEVVWQSGGIDKLEIYRRLGVPEVWFWMNHRISIHVLDQRGRYVEREQSACLPSFDFALALQLMEMSSFKQVRRILRERFG